MMIKKENRLLGTNEKVFWVLDQKTSSHFAVVAEIEGNASDHAWRQALDTVQKRHPNLSVKISGNEYSTACLEHVEDCQIPLKIVNTTEGANWDSELESEMKIPFDITTAPLVRTVLIQQPGKTIFILLSNHSIGDGMSAALLIRDILGVLSGKPMSNLPALPPLDALAGLPHGSKDDTQPNDFIQVKNSLLPKPNVEIRRLEFSKSLTENLIKRSKTEQTTVHGALSAALVLALKQTSESFKPKPVRILHPLSARNSLGLGDNYNLLLNIVTLPYEPAPNETFWGFARNVRKSIATLQKAQWIKDDTLATRELFCNGLDMNTIEQALYQGTEHEILLTNLGQISFQSDYGKLKLTSLWGPMVLTPHQTGQTVGVATFNGRLTLTLTGCNVTDELLESAENILNEVCRTNEDIEIGEFLNDLINRPLGSFERMSWLINQTRCSHFALSAQITGNADVSKWRSALNAVQARHPILSMGINGGNIYEPFFESKPNREIPMRVIETSDPNRWEKEMEAELALPIGHSKAPMLRTVLVRQRDSAVIIISTHHAIADGIGLSFLVRDLVMALAGIPLQKLPMSPSADMLLAKNETLLTKSPLPESENFNVESISKSQQKPQFECIKISPELTESIIENAKRESATVHGAICAAFVIAARRLSDEMNNRPVTLLASASCRKSVGLTDECGAYLTTKSTNFINKKETSFWNLARQAKAGISGCGTLEDFSTDTTMLNQLFFDKDVLATEAIAEMMFQYDFVISNIGLIEFETSYGSFKIESLYGPALLFKISDENNIGVATINGALHITQISRNHMHGLLKTVLEVFEEVVSVEVD